MNAAEIRAAAKKYNVSTSTIYAHVRAGWTPDRPLKLRHLTKTGSATEAEVNAALRRWRA